MLCTQKTSRLALALLATTMLTQPGPARAAPGDALGPEFQVNTFTLGDQVLPAVAMDADGHFVVAWEGYGSSELKGIFAKRFDATGVAQGSEFLVNSFTTNNQNWSAIAMDADGDFVVAWESRDQDGSLYGIFAQRFDAAGVAQGSEVQVNTFSTSAQRLPAVAMDTDGDFVVAWTSYEQDGSDWGVFAQRYDAAGVAQGPEFQVNTFTTGTQWFPAVAMDADGDFVVAWEGYGSGEANGIFAQRYDAAGAAQGPEFQVNTFTAFDQAFPAVAMDADGDFVVAWQSPQDGSFRGVFAQRYDAAGVAQGPEFQVNTFTTGDQADPAVAMDADGDFVVAWASAFQDDSLDGVFAQRYDGVERVEGDFDGDGNADLLWRNASTGNTVIWLMEGTAKLAAQPIGVVPPVWQVVATGDFNGDGKADILWRHTGNGSTLVWQMDGFTKVAAVGIGNPPLVWVVEKLRDTNGDGISDIFWRNSTTGRTLVWQMLGFTKVATGGTGGVNAVWEVQ